MWKLQPCTTEICHSNVLTCPYNIIDKTDMEPQICKYWSYNTDYLFEVECPPLAMFVVMMRTSVTGATIPNNAKTIHLWVILDCLNLSDKNTWHTYELKRMFNSLDTWTSF